MKEINYWKQFMTTGKVEDFLAYKNYERYREEDSESKDCTDIEKQDIKERLGEHSHAGIYRDYGDGFKG